MKHFFVITNIKKDSNKAYTEQVMRYITEKGGTCACYYSTGQECEGEELTQEQIPADTECILVLGGDGTLIRAARDVHHLNVPLMGINLGTLGYLCEVEENHVESAIDAIMADEYLTEERMMLEGYCKRGGELHKSRIAFNDVVIHRGTNPTVCTLSIKVNGEYLHTYSGDGIVIATPNGSTAYSMSSGGPIVDPKASLLVITPINTHSLNSKSIVLSADDVIEIEISSRGHEANETAEVRFDGDYPVQLQVGDKVVVKKAGCKTRILKLSKKSFLEILSKKMQNYI